MILYINRTTRKIVSGQKDATERSIGAHYREDELPLKIYIVENDPDGGLQNPMRLVDITNISLKVGIGVRNGKESPIALQNTWTKNTTDNYFEGSLSLNTTAIDTRIKQSDQSEFTEWFEVEITEGGDRQTILQQQIRIRGDVLRAGVLSPDEVPIPSAFVNTLETALVESNTITWTRNGDDIKGQVKRQTNSGLVEDANGLAADFGTGANQVARGDTVHDAVTICTPSTIVPAMTANSESSGHTASATSETVGKEAYKAFDGDINTRWESETHDTTAGEISTFVAIELPSATIVRGFEIQDPNLSTVSEIKWRFEASNDGLNWTKLKEIEFNKVQFNTRLPVANETAYDRYRIVFEYRPDRGTYTSFLNGFNLFEHLPSIEIDVNGQELCPRVKIDPDGGIEAGPDGVRLRSPDLDESGDPIQRGYPIYAAVAPDISDNPLAAVSLWVDTSKNPRTLNVYNSTTEEWEPVNTVTIEDTATQSQGAVIVSSIEPDVDAFPELANVLWINPTNPPSINVWNKHTKAWMNTCAICDSGAGGYIGKLATPTFDPPGGTPLPVDVTIKHPTNSVTIHYTTDGSTPTTGSPVYDGNPISLSAVTTLKALAVKTDWNDSDIGSATYDVLTIESWLLNFNFSETFHPAKIGGAATGNNANDRWNVLGTGANNSAVSGLKLADGKNSVVTGVVNAPVADAQIMSGMVDNMFRYYWQKSNTISLQLSNVPLGVYNIFIFAHGPQDAHKASISVEGLTEPSAKETTNTTGWKNTAWQEGKQFVKFDEFEPTDEGKLTIRANAIDTQDGSGSPIKAFIQGIQIRKLDQLPAPRFEHPDGYEFQTNFTVRMYEPRPLNSDILFTDDGTDPSGTAASPSGTTQVYDPDNPPVISATTTFKARLVTVDSPADSKILTQTFTKLP